MYPALAGSVPSPRLFWATRLLHRAQTVLASIGLLVLVSVAVPGVRDFITRQATIEQPVLQRQSSERTTILTGTIQSSIPALETERDQRALTEFIAKRYRVSDAAIASFVSAAYRAGKEQSVDPVLILAIMAIESRYNPVAESLVGARGLMQIIPKYHSEKLAGLGGETALLDPEVNIYVGAQIVREYHRRFGNLQTALQVYGGAFDEPTAQYSAKVFAERARLDEILRKARRDA